MKVTFSTIFLILASAIYASARNDTAKNIWRHTKRMKTKDRLRNLGASKLRHLGAEDGSTKAPKAPKAPKETNNAPESSTKAPKATKKTKDTKETRDRKSTRLNSSHP